MVTLCVHWFNPLVWVMYVLANRDLELSCDESVIRLFGENTKSAYARTLISMEETRSGLRPLCNSFSKNAIEERIVAIMKTKKTSLAAMLTAAIVIVGVGTVFATSAQATSNTSDENTASLIADEAILSTTDENGTVKYSTDAVMLSGYDETAIETVTQDDTTLESTYQSGQEVSVATGEYTTESGDTGTEFMEDMAKYAPFGVTFVQSGNFGNLYWNGKLVDILVDQSPDGGYMTISSEDEGGVKIQTVYDSNGKLTGVEATEPLP
jgi:YD repeat-containing protein